jgi:hypothetical protein
MPVTIYHSGQEKMKAMARLRWTVHRPGLFTKRPFAELNKSQLGNFRFRAHLFLKEAQQVSVLPSANQRSISCLS